MIHWIFIGIAVINVILCLLLAYMKHQDKEDYQGYVMAAIWCSLAIISEIQLINAGV